MASWRVPCKSWNCPSCSRKKAKAVSARVHENFKNARARHLTLTLKPRGSIPEALTHINQAWNRLSTRIRYKYGNVKYFKVLEPQHGTNMPHFHILLNKFIPTSWLNVQIQKAGFGKIYKIKDASNEQVFNYVNKYLRKGFTDEAFLEALLATHGRRYSFSRCCFALPSQHNYHPVYFIKTDSLDSFNAFMYMMWFRISKSCQLTPLSSDPYFTEFFIPAPVGLLPAPPSSACVRGD